MEIQLKLINEALQIKMAKENLDWQDLCTFLRKVIGWDKKLSINNINAIIKATHEDLKIQAKLQKKEIFSKEEITSCIDFWSKKEMGYNFARPDLQNKKLNDIRNKLEQEQLQKLMEKK